MGCGGVGVWGCGLNVALLIRATWRLGEVGKFSIFMVVRGLGGSGVRLTAALNI